VHHDARDTVGARALIGSTQQEPRVTTVDEMLQTTEQATQRALSVSQASQRAAGIGVLDDPVEPDPQRPL